MKVKEESEKVGLKLNIPIEMSTMQGMLFCVPSLQFTMCLSLKVENLKEFDHFFFKLKKKKKRQHSKNEDHGIWSHQFSSVQSHSRVQLFATP